ncbi:sulfite exporter TauE/SafE family protein [Deltaproteobacteria bacterium TL4]
MELTQGFILFAVGTVAGFINVMAGGGSSLTLPTMLFMGLDGALANGTNRVAICIQNVFAIAGFHKHDIHEFGTSLKFSLFALPGAMIGALVAVHTDNLWFQRILGMVMLGVVLSMIFPISNVSKEAPLTPFKQKMGYFAMFGIGFYGGFIQIGVGILIMAILFHSFHLNLIRVNMHKVFIVFIYTLPALLIFIWSGNVNWPMGLSLASGNALGAWIAAHVSVKGGERVIRSVLMVTILLMSLKLLFSL